MKVRSGIDVPDLISVIITTYEREDALDAVLAALSRQGDRGFEVVIADDGSGPGTADLVERWRSRLGVALRHVCRRIAGFARPKSATAPCSPARATIAFFSTATASRRPTSLRHIASWPSLDGSSRATACSCLRR